MTENDVKNWLIDKMEYCYAVQNKYNKDLFFLYDESYIRKLKISKLNKKYLDIPDIIKGKCLFEIPYSYMSTYYYRTLFVDYYNVWKFIEQNFSENYDIIQHTISELSNSKIEHYNINVKYFNISENIAHQRFKDFNSKDFKNLKCNMSNMLKSIY